MQTDAGNSQTDWTAIAAAAGDDEVARQALERLSRRYWPAIYAYLRSTGRDVHEAADLTQGFVCDVILERGLFEAADPERGRFRALLLASLKNYVRGRHRHDTRAQRSDGGRAPLHLDGPRLAAAGRTTHLTPDAAFVREWSMTLVRRVLDRVRRECQAAGLAAHWEIFEHRVARPMLLGTAPTDYAVLVPRLALEDASQAANMMITAKRRFARALREEVAETVVAPDLADEEMRQLLRDLEGGS